MKIKETKFLNIYFIISINKNDNKNMSISVGICIKIIFLTKPLHLKKKICDGIYRLIIHYFCNHFILKIILCLNLI